MLFLSLSANQNCSRVSIITTLRLSCLSKPELLFESESLNCFFSSVSLTVFPQSTQAINLINAGNLNFYNKMNCKQTNINKYKHKRTKNEEKLTHVLACRPGNVIIQSLRVDTWKKDKGKLNSWP